MVSHEAPTQQTVEAHEKDIDTLSEWSNEALSEEDQAVLDQLADEAKQARSEDGTLTMAAQELAEQTRRVAEEDAKAHEDATWRFKPDSKA